MMGGVGFRPTNASVSVFNDRLAELEVARKDFDRLMTEVAAFNKAHAGKVTAISDRMPSTAR